MLVREREGGRKGERELYITELQTVDNLYYNLELDEQISIVSQL